MFRSLLSSCRSLGAVLSKTSPILSAANAQNVPYANFFSSTAGRNAFSTLRSSSSLHLRTPFIQNRCLLEPKTTEVSATRTLIKYSLQRGKRTTVKEVLSRFYRLDWGIWIRPKCGRHKKIYKKSFRRRRRLRQHVFTNATQSWLLDTMVTRYWRRPKYYPDDPYNPYHKRDEFPLTRKIPKIPVAS